MFDGVTMVPKTRTAAEVVRYISTGAAADTTRNITADTRSTNDPTAEDPSRQAPDGQ
jgi:hypothetical protein